MIAAVDASVLIKGYIPENLSEKANKVFEHVVEGKLLLIAPDLILPEVGNILWKKHRLKELTEIEVNEILKEILLFPLKIESSKSLITFALELAIIYDITVYDSLYFSLALLYNTKLITADERLVDKLKVSEYRKYIKWLGEY